MNWIDKLMSVGTKKDAGGIYAGMLNGSIPVYSMFGKDIFASDVVKQAIQRIAMEVSKLNLVHVRTIAKDEAPVGNSSVQKMLNHPNNLMTTGELLEKTIWNLYSDYNAFLIPVYEVWNEGKNERRIYKELYPVKPMEVTFIEDKSGTLFVKMKFYNGFEMTLPYEDVIHVRLQFSWNDYMGGNAFGRPDNDTLLKTLRINENILDAVGKATKASMAINGIVKYGSLVSRDKVEADVKLFEEEIRKSASGILGIDAKSEYIPIKKDIKLLDEKTVEFIDTKILRNFGTSTKILIGEYTKEEYEAFYQTTLEPLAIRLGQSFTKALFTPWQRSYGDAIKVYPEEMMFVTVSQKIEIARILGDSGALLENEKRKLFGLAPLPELEGMRKQSLNYVDTKIANTYQIQQKGEKNGEE
nr:MAG TPA: portal protein [Caudoviricetes sp.]